MITIGAHGTASRTARGAVGGQRNAGVIEQVLDDLEVGAGGQRERWPPRDQVMQRQPGPIGEALKQPACGHSPEGALGFV